MTRSQTQQAEKVEAPQDASAPKKSAQLPSLEENKSEVTVAQLERASDGHATIRLGDDKGRYVDLEPYGDPEYAFPFGFVTTRTVGDGSEFQDVLVNGAWVRATIENASDGRLRFDSKD